jgi:hypothetical protein
MHFGRVTPHMKSGVTLQFIWGLYLIVSSREISYKLCRRENPSKPIRIRRGVERTGALRKDLFLQQ